MGRGIASNPSAAHRRSDLCRSSRPFPGYHVSRARGHAPRVDAGGESRLTLTRRGKVAVSAAFVLFSVVPALLVGLDGGWGAGVTSFFVVTVLTGGIAAMIVEWRVSRIACPTCHHRTLVPPGDTTLTCPRCRTRINMVRSAGGAG